MRAPRRTHYAKDVDESLIGREVTVAGWVEDKRPVGKLLFITVRDRTGVVQVLFKRNEDGGLWSVAERVPRQSFVVVTGTVKMGAGKVEIRPRAFEVVGEAKHPLPLDPSGRTPASLPIILDARPLSLRVPAIKAIFKIRSTVANAIREFLHERGFIEVHTPKLISSATEGGAALFEVDYLGRKAYLAQSPQLYKEQLCAALDKVFEIAPAFRAEKSHTTRHVTEFTSVDVEVAFADYNDVMELLEELIEYCCKRSAEENADEYAALGVDPIKPERPFPKITYNEAFKMVSGAVYGEDFETPQLKEIGKKVGERFYFITDWPAKSKPFYIKEKEGGLSESFDLMFSWVELASGGTRVDSREELERKLREQGLNPASFEYHLKVFDWGMPPHAGWGLGLDRLIQVMTKRENVREVILYPRDPERLVP